MTPSFRYEETENTKRLVLFEADDRAVVRFEARTTFSRFLDSLKRSRRERRAEARQGSGRRRMGAKRVSAWRPPPMFSPAPEVHALVRHLYHADGIGYVALYLPEGVKPTAEDECALQLASGYRRPTWEEMEAKRLAEKAEEVEAARAFKPNLPPWW